MPRSDKKGTPDDSNRGEQETADRDPPEHRLRESAAQAWNLLDANFDGMVLAVDGRIAFANRAMWRLAGCISGDEMLGRPPADFIVEEQRQRVRSQIARAMTGDGKVEPTEYLGRRVDGSTIPVEVLGRRIAVKGRAAILAAVRDITARKEAESARRRAETELRRVLDAVPDLIWSGEITEAGVMRLRWASPALASLTGRPSTFWQGEQLRWLAVVHPDDRQRVKDLADQLITGERDGNEQEYRIVRPDGTVRWVRDSAVVSEGAAGVRPIQGVVSDITQRKLSEQEVNRHRQQVTVHGGWTKPT